MSTVRLSVVVPTYQRRELVLIAVQALARQAFADTYEVIVVVDGSTDGTAAALRAVTMPVPLTILEQENRGAAAARSAGGFAARGEILLFLDDDMEADPGLLAEHDRCHREGAEVVLGHIPLHPDSPPGLLRTWVDDWVETRARRLSRPGATVRVADLIGGQISVTRRAFEAVGGFDARFTLGGTFGSEDVDFGYRLLRHGCRVRFNPAALSRQRYSVRPRQFMRQWRQAGRATVRLARKHPEIAAEVLRCSLNRRRFRSLAGLGVLTAPVRWLAVALAERGHRGRLTERLCFTAQAIEFCRGLREAGGVPRPRALRVLAYHAIADTAGAGAFGPYGVGPEEFRRQIDTLLHAGYHFVGAEEVTWFLRGAGGLPRRPVLLTFDDCYVSVLEHALPILVARGVPAVAFAVTARLGGTNDWARGRGVPALPLLDDDGLRRLAKAGVEIGAHSRSHLPLSGLSPDRLAEEVGGSCEELRALGLSPVRFFAFPYGEADVRAREAVAAAGCEGAFLTDPGVVRSGMDRFRLPRVEILRGDAGWRFRWKVAIAGPLRPGKVGLGVYLRELWQRWGAPLTTSAGRPLAAGERPCP